MDAAGLSVRRTMAQHRARGAQPLRVVHVGGHEGAVAFGALDAQPPRAHLRHAAAGQAGFVAPSLGFALVFLIGFILGPMAELSLRQAMIITDGKITSVTNHPVALLFLALAALSIWRLSTFRRIRARMGDEQA